MSALLLLELTMLPTRSGLWEPWRVEDPPARCLPIASHGWVCMGCVAGPEIGLSGNRRWLIEGRECASDEDLKEELRIQAARSSRLGYAPHVRVRIGADAPARHFVALTHLLEECGIGQIRVAVLRSSNEWR